MSIFEIQGTCKKGRSGDLTPSEGVQWTLSRDLSLLSSYFGRLPIPMRGLLLAALSVFLVCPASGQFVYGEAGLTVPMGSFTYAKTGFQGGVTGRVPVVESDLDLSAILRVGYNVNPLPQGEIRRLSGLLGPELTYTHGRTFAKTQIAGGLGVALGEDQERAWMVRSRISIGIETSSGSQLSIGPTHAATSNNQLWWGISCAFSF